MNSIVLLAHSAGNVWEYKRMLSELSDEFDVEITAEDIVPENFESVKSIYNMIKRLEDED